MSHVQKISNTLAELDARAATLPRARSWLNYPYFMFARSPHLRPLKNDRTFWQKLEEWEKRIESDSKAAPALADLNPDLRQQLAALLVDIIAEIEMCRKKISPKAESRKRMLLRKREKARRELENLRDYAGGLDRVLAGDDEEAAGRCLEI